MYRDPALTEKPALLEQRGGAFYSEAATGLVALARTGDGAVHEVDMRNDGTLAGLAADDVVEVPARVGRDGPVPLAQPPLAPELLGLTQHVAAYERLAVEAALTRDAVTCARRCSRIRSSASTRWRAAGRAAAGGASRCAVSGLVLAVDGGNSKTDLALVARGRRAARARARRRELAAPPRARRLRRAC